MNVDISQLQPGVFGVSHGSGLAGELIRHATESWAGHAFIYIGAGRIAEAQPPVATISPATKYADAVWAWKMPLAVPGCTTTDDPELGSITTVQAAIVARAHALVGTPYDWPAYAGFALEVLKLRSGAQLDPAFKSDRWRVCSALVADCYEYAKDPLPFDPAYDAPAPAGADQIENWPPNLISPAMLYNLAARQGWT